jgi:methylenetetrahydrofolate dehydrogenase (NADP+)/methenyltetrahydrofolate cyclohydrolase
MLLYGKPVADKIKQELKLKVSKYFPNKDMYLAILFFWDNSSSKIYVKHKQKYWNDIWLTTNVFWQDSEKKREKEDVINLINKLNKDENCVGIIVQLPLPENLKQSKNEILSTINPAKDVDGLWGTLIWKSFFDMVSFCPATPKAVMTLLDYYNIWILKNKRVAIIGQSTIVWKPLALECLKRKAFVACFDINNTVEEIKRYCQTADYIFSATWQIHLIDETYVNNKKNQIVIDIGYWHKDWKPVGDVDTERVENKVLHITPVPWGVGPLTIASLFSNIIDLWEQFN